MKSSFIKELLDYLNDDFVENIFIRKKIII